MTKRISILLDDKLEERLRMLQAKLIRKRKKGVAFSDLINEIIKKGLEDEKTK